ncbi:MULTISPECIES: hypothetical protein [unclassified Roseivivax]|uniref:hypothetical protein n=1 Tax=Roseivivax sp. GX 12232 TaxID=2900547 RepID=UPI001E58690D|nr:hypothetical protein [Roseivivax sp. GX 12232]MCE0506071.1 hypothetical protein [Roseivivax sp. GX 12232]
MDPVSVTYYAAICGCLSLLSHRLGRAWMRLALGVGVGVAAALVLPLLRPMVW